MSEFVEGTNQVQFFAEWHSKIKSSLPHYDAFFGFSLGGVVLQQCFDLFKNAHKPLILFSVPSFSDGLLSERLDHVINLIKENSVIAAIHELNLYVFHPHSAPKHMAIQDIAQAASRLLHGLQFVRDTDSRHALKKFAVSYLHLIGEESLLVNSNNVEPPVSGELIMVPKSGMRILQNNVSYCMVPIIKFLEGAA